MQDTTKEYYNNSKLVYSVTKKYPDFSKIYIRTSTMNSNVKQPTFVSNKPRITSEVTNLEDSLRRSKTTISDLVLSNKFDMFATFTFNCNNCPHPCPQKSCDITHPHTKDDCNTISCTCPPQLCDRLNPEICKRRMSVWLANQQKKYGQFKYIIVPEWHERGGLHFHAMIKGFKGKLKQAENHRTKKKQFHRGHPIYNITSYRNGYTTMKVIGNSDEDIAKVSNYIRKYITKDMPQFKGRKRYWTSQNLVRPETTTDDSLIHNPYIEKRKVFENDRMIVLRANVQNLLRNMPQPVIFREPTN